MRIIAHIDMDAFFASVEERDNPRFAGKPIVIGSDPKGGAGRGVVSTANYKARKYGIRSALPISKAWRFSQEAAARGEEPAVFLDVNMERYSDVSHAIIAIVRKHAEHIEQASIDEAYIDLSFTGSYEKAEEVARAIKLEIKESERLTASVGIGPNKLIAKIASDRQKPDGLTVVREDEVEQFLEPLSIRAIPGVGPKAEEKFKALGVATVKDAKRLTLEALQKMMGKWGGELYGKLRGKSDAEIVEEWEAKSIGEQETFEHDTHDAIFLQERLRMLAREVHGRFLSSGFKEFRSLTITVRFADFTTKSRAITLEKPDDRAATIEFESLRLFMPFLDMRENPGRKAFRLLGVRIEKLA